jgi:hypothetical protein
LNVTLDRNWMTQLSEADIEPERINISATDIFIWHYRSYLCIRTEMIL